MVKLWLVSLVFCLSQLSIAFGQGASITISAPTCSVTCGVGIDGDGHLCNPQPCPDECDKCVLTNGGRYLEDLFDCNCYYQCVPVKAKHDGKLVWRVEHRCCANCLHWDPSICACDYACCDTCTTGTLVMFINGDVADVFNTDGGSSSDPLNITCDRVCVGEGASWTATDGNGVVHDFEPGQYYNVTGTVDVLEKDYISTAGDWESWSSWSECYAWCDGDGQASAMGQQRKRRGRHVTNWCDRECPCVEVNKTCTPPTDFECPTMFTRHPCPVIFWLEFNGNTEDRFGAAVMAPIGKVGFSTDHPGNCDSGDQSGVFNGDVLQVPFFNNWFTEPNDRAFTVSMWFKTDQTDAHLLQNGCYRPDGSLGVTTVYIHVRNGTLMGGVKLADRDPGSDDHCEINNILPNSNWQFVTLIYNGDTLRMMAGDGCQHSCEIPCQGRLDNNKCDLYLGHHLEPASPDRILDGLMDEVKVYTMAQEMDDLDCCPCPPAGIATTTPVATTPIVTTPVATTPVVTTPVATTPVVTTPTGTGMQGDTSWCAGRPDGGIAILGQTYTISGPRFQWCQLLVHIDVGGANVVVETTGGGTADLIDLYAKLGSFASFASYDDGSGNDENEENVLLDAAGDWYIGVWAHQAYTNIDVIVRTE